LFISRVGAASEGYRIVKLKASGILNYLIEIRNVNIFDFDGFT